MYCIKRGFKSGVCFTRKLSSIATFPSRKLSYVKSMRTLESLKTGSSLSDDMIEKGKCMFLIKSDLVCVKGNDELLWKDYKEIASWGYDKKRYTVVLLDLLSDAISGDTCLFGLNFNITSEQEIKDLELNLGSQFIGARESLLKLNEKDCQYVAKAKGLSFFNWTCNYCSFCGSRLLMQAIGTQKQCEKCKRVHYPQISPVGIVLLEDKLHENVLLIRQHRHPSGMFSCISGFIEPGETLYEGIAREVAEEVGLLLINVDFCLSQYWAMSSSQLMLACIATVEDKQFEIDEKEILGAQWVSSCDLREAVNRARFQRSLHDIDKNVFFVPPPSTASHQLMLEWLNKYH